MELRHIVAATDESSAGREAVRTSIELATRTGARVTVMRAVPALREIPVHASSSGVENSRSSMGRLRHWLGEDFPALASTPMVSFAVSHGLPGVEITRFAEQERADLVVLGRKSRSALARLVIGDTADAVARRSSLPCLFVPGAGILPRRVLAAVDGSDRGMAVLSLARDLVRQLGAELRIVTVEPMRPGETAELAASIPGAHSVELDSRVRSTTNGTLDVRHGDVVGQILSTVDTYAPDVLVIGCHRGGPPGVVDARSVARRLAHTAPCAILTVPL